MDDAEIAIITLGSSAGTVRTKVERLRSKGIPIGMIKLRVSGLSRPGNWQKPLQG